MKPKFKPVKDPDSDKGVATIVRRAAKHPDAFCETLLQHALEEWNRTWSTDPDPEMRELFWGDIRDAMSVVLPPHIDCCRTAEMMQDSHDGKLKVRPVKNPEDRFWMLETAARDEVWDILIDAGYNG